VRGWKAPLFTSLHGLFEDGRARVCGRKNSQKADEEGTCLDRHLLINPTGFWQRNGLLIIWHFLMLQGNPEYLVKWKGWSAK